MKNLAKTLALAFNDYPSFKYVLPIKESRVDKLAILFEVISRYTSRYGNILKTSENECALLYFLPNHQSISNVKMIGCGALKILTKLGVKFISKQNSIDKIQNALRRKHAPPHHSYLMTIGTNPKFQGKGYGGKLLEMYLAEMDLKNIPVYLETAKEENVQIYKRYGFQVKGKCHVDKGDFAIWALVRS